MCVTYRDYYACGHLQNTRLERCARPWDHLLSPPSVRGRTSALDCLECARRRHQRQWKFIKYGDYLGCGFDDYDDYKGDYKGDSYDDSGKGYGCDGYIRVYGAGYGGGGGGVGGRGDGERYYSGDEWSEPSYDYEREARRSRRRRHRSWYTPRLSTWWPWTEVYVSTRFY